MGAHPETAKVLPAGVDLGHYSLEYGGSEIRGRYGLTARDLVLFFMGWVYPFSGLREVAESLVAGEGHEVGAKLLVVGKGDSWAELNQIAKRAGAEDRIKLVEFRPYSELPSYLAAADICLLPAEDVATMRNIVPIKMYEYLASGRPVIATRLPGLVKEFGEGNGVVYVDRPEEVVGKAGELVRQGLIPQLGARGRAFVSGNDWQKVTDAFESFLKDLVESRGR
jgi:glycosyltransferase involved in cell wall biosynthesis